jgi:hypothetical protein
MKSTSFHVCEIHFQRQEPTKTYTNGPRDDNCAIYAGFYRSNLHYIIFTLTNVEILTSDTLKSDSPDRLYTTMIARYILVPYVLVNLVDQFEKRTFLL